MGLAEIKDWLKTFGIAENYYVGRIDNKKEMSLGVYSRDGPGSPVMALGGTENSSYDIKRISLLLHWNKNARETEETALALWDALFGRTDIDVPSGSHIQYVQPAVPEPVPIGTDDGGVYEYVINLNIYYRR